VQSHVSGLDVLMQGHPPTDHPDIPALILVNVQLPNVSPSLSAQVCKTKTHISISTPVLHTELACNSDC
jgi:hypothetical protein